MTHCNGIDVSEGIDIHKKSGSKDCIFIANGIF